MKKTKKTKANRRQFNINIWLYLCASVCCLALIGIGIGIKLTNVPKEEITINPVTYSDEPMPAFIDDGKGEMLEIEDIPTVEEVDGGLFGDKNTGVSITDGKYQDLGWFETFDVSSPEAFRNDTINKCIIANNIYGAQCVSLARVFWWSYADRDISTCGTGMAKGMMNCAEQNAGDEFLIYWADDSYQIQAGDWLVFTGGRYGHIGMALGTPNQGYVTLLGENQGGRVCDEGGAATNIININLKNLIGFYRPKAYYKAPQPTPIAPDTGMGK